MIFDDDLPTVFQVYDKLLLSPIVPLLSFFLINETETEAPTLSIQDAQNTSSFDLRRGYRYLFRILGRVYPIATEDSQ